MTPTIYGFLWRFLFVCCALFSALGGVRAQQATPKATPPPDAGQDPDKYSRADLRDAIDIAQRTETTVFAISTKAGLAGAVPGVQMGQVKSKADNNLVKLAEETGGRAFFTGDMLELERAFNGINKKLRAQYLVTYKPSNDRYDGSFRKLEVKLANGQNGLRVRTKHGYTAIADSVRP